MTTEIVRLASLGDGVTADGRHMAGTAPGDLIDDEGLIRHGPHRRTPLCRHFGQCGGCNLQHVDDAAYADFLIDRIHGALAGQGISAPATALPHLSPPKTRRRASLKALRRGRQVLLGFNAAASHAIIDLAECPVLHPRLMAVIPHLRTLLLDILPAQQSTSVTLALCDQGVDLGFGAVAGGGSRLLHRLTAFAIEHDLARLSADLGYGAEPLHAPVPPTVSFDGVPVFLPIGAFLQATDDGQNALIQAVRDAAGDSRRIVDLFAGLGTFTLPLSRQAQLLAVEGAGAAIKALDEAARRAGRPIMTQHRDLFRAPLTAEELNRFDAVVLDPPRAGAKAQSLEIARSSVPRLAMVSCNPSSFARDARILIEGGWKLEKLWPVGQFRWSTHVELVAAFER